MMDGCRTVIGRDSSGKSLLLALHIVLCLLLVAGCGGPTSGKAVAPPGKLRLDSPGEGARGEDDHPGYPRVVEEAASDTDPELFRRQEVEELAAQPYIDPLTRYLEQYADDPARERYLKDVALLREQRCTLVGKRYALLPKTAETYERFRAGYAFSCPAQLEEFADLVEDLQKPEEPATPLVTVSPAPPPPDPQRSECYLLTQIRNYTEAHDFCLGPAEEGDPRAQLNMALISQAAKEYAQALRWAEMVAADLPEAGLILGQLYADGHGVERNPRQAAFWFRRAAEQGLSSAQTALGLLYLDGDGAVFDPRQARQWLLKAARQNEGRALYSLGEMSETGLAVDQDLVEALVWYDLASRNGMRDARVKVEMLGQEVTGEQFSRAEQRVRQLLAGE